VGKMVAWNEIPSPQVLSSNQTRGIEEGQRRNRRLGIPAGLQGKESSGNQALIWTVIIAFLSIKYRFVLELIDLYVWVSWYESCRKSKHLLQNN
jgi:hypothetical protein